MKITDGRVQAFAGYQMTITNKKNVSRMFALDLYLYSY
jgi:hypothetical protein